MRKFAMWIIQNVPIGFLAPHVLAFAIGCKKYKKIEDAPQEVKDEKQASA